MVKKVNITVDVGLLERVDEYANDYYTTRSGVFAMGASMLINQADLMRAVRNLSEAMRRIADSGEVDPDTMKRLEDFERIALLCSRP